MAVNADAIVSKLTLDTSGFESGVSSSKALIATLVDSSKTASEKVGAIGTALEGLGQTLTKTVTAGVAAAAAAATAAAVSLDDVSRKVVTIADTTVVSMEEIKDGLSSMAAETGQSAESLGEGMYSVISATGNTADALAYTEIAAKAAVGGFTDTQIAVDGLTTVMNAYGMSGSEAMQKVSDQMLMTQNYGKTTFGELSQSIGQVIPLAATLSVTTDDLFASVAVLTKQGIATSSAMAGLKAAYSNILKPTTEAAEAAKELGLDFSASAIESKGWVGFLEDLQEKTGGDTEVLAKLFGSVEALNTVLALTSETGSSDMVGALEAMGTAAGATEEAFETMTGGVSGQWNEIKQQFTAIAASFGELLLPTISNVLTKVSEVLSWFSNLNPTLQQTIINIAGIAAAVGPVVTVIGKLVTVGSAIMGVMSGPAGWIALAVAGVAALTVALIKMDSQVETVEDRFNNMVNGADAELTAEITASIDVTSVEDEVDELNQAETELHDNLMGLSEEGILSDEEVDMIAAAITGDTATVNGYLAGGYEGVFKFDPSVWSFIASKSRMDRETLKEGLKGLGLSDEEVDEVIAAYDTYKETLYPEITSVYDDIYNLLTDGKSDTEVDETTGKSQAETLADEVIEYYSGLITEANTLMEERKAELEGLLGAGLIDQETYAEAVAQVEADNEEVQANIKTTQEATLAYVTSMAGESTGTVKASFDQIQQLRDEAYALAEEIDALRQSSEMTAGEASFNLTKSGQKVSTTTVGEAVGYASNKYVLTQAETENWKQEQMLEADRQYNAAMKLAGDDASAQETANQGLNAMRQQIETEAEQRNAAAMAEYQSDVGEIIQGVTESGQEELVSATVAAMQKYGVFEDTGMTEADVMEKVSDGYKDKTKRKAADKYNESAKRKLLGTDGKELIGPIQQENVANSVDTALSESAESVSTTASEVYGPQVADSMVSGVTDEIEEKSGEIEEAGASIGSGAFEALKTEIQMNSPSKLFATAGESMVDGIVEGAGGRKQKLKDKFKELAKAALQAAKDELGIASPSKKFAEIGAYSVAGWTSGVNKSLLEKSAAGMVTTSVTNNSTSSATYNLTFPNLSVRNDNDLRTLSKQLEASITRSSRGRGTTV